MIHLNTQPPEKASHTRDGNLDVVSIFYTIQGEGPLAGTPAVFVRLAGCNLQCPGCDTDYTTNRKIMTPFAIEEEAHRLRHAFANFPRKQGLVVITGGEPFRQNIKPLVDVLHQLSWKVQIESNGTMFPNGPFPFNKIDLVISPKTPTINSGFHNINPKCTLKYVITDGEVDQDDGLPTITLDGLRPGRPWENYTGDIYVQPAETNSVYQNDKNTEACVRSAMKYGYRLSLQLHKILGLE